MSPFILLVTGILVAFGLLIAFAMAVGPVLTGVAIPRIGVALFSIGLGVLICWLVSAVASSLGLSPRQRLAVALLSGALVGVLALLLFWRPVAAAWYEANPAVAGIVMDAETLVLTAAAVRRQVQLRRAIAQTCISRRAFVASAEAVERREIDQA